MQMVTCAEVSSTYNMFSSLLSYDSLGIAKGFYESKQVASFTVLHVYSVCVTNC